MASSPIIGTHNGKFHCDEVLACVMLKRLPKYQNAEIIRTRDEDVLKTCDIVVDVGSIYDPATLRFDHHQKSFNHSMSTIHKGKPWTTRLSSAGLIYAHFGREVLAYEMGRDVELEGLQKATEQGLERLYDKVYEDFIEEIDGCDNGIPLCDHPTRYKVTTTLSDRVSYLNPSWKDEDADEYAAFLRAYDVVCAEFTGRVKYYFEDWLGAHNIVRDALNSRFDVDPSGQIVEFGSGGVPWKDHLLKLEKSLDIDTPIQFVIFQAGVEGMWRVQAVPIEPTSFTTRTPLKKEWQGLRGKELEEISGIPTIQFVHANGFIGGATERESAIKMAKDTLHASKSAH